jgi:hypothetical protein
MEPPENTTELDDSTSTLEPKNKEANDVASMNNAATDGTSVPKESAQIPENELEEEISKKK